MSVCEKHYLKTKLVWLFLLSWMTLLLIVPMPLVALIDYSVFAFLGILGAIFANSTGAGGGVIFIPFFNQLNFTEQQAVATSFAIQCFGMTAGAITWYIHYQKEKLALRVWRGFKRIIMVAAMTAVIGIWTVYLNDNTGPSSLHYSFSWFSLVLGLAIVAIVYLAPPQKESSQLIWFDYFAIAAIGFIGGAVTAWLSVGVGEILAIYLILRRFDVTMAVASAVIVSAITVWSAIWQHTVLNFTVYWQVVVFAGPAAIIGGIVAKTLVSKLSARKLKLFFSCWLIIIGAVGLKP